MRSMTGYGSASGRVGAVEIGVEARSVNHRNLDIKLALPREYVRWESDLRRLVSARFARGRLEIYVARTLADGARQIALQRDVVRAYLRAWKTLQREFGVAGEINLSLFQNRNDVFQPRAEVADAAAEESAVRRLLERALAALDRERGREGRHLARDMRARTTALATLAKALEQRSKIVAPMRRERLELRLRDLLGRHGLDEGRLAQEAAMLAERCDVTEEIVRLRSHVAALRTLCAESGPVGKRMDFLLQEIQRELNTVGAKANDLETTRLVLDGKAEVEKLREQVQNVE